MNGWARIDYKHEQKQALKKEALNMAKVGAQRAAELTGKSKSTVQRAMKNGKISFEKDSNGRRVIDVAELERAFGLIPQQGERNHSETVESELKKASEMLEVERLKMRIKILEEQLDSVKEREADLVVQRDQWQKQAQQVLLTSQYSQKQAEELKTEMKAREQRARMRRQQAMERRMQEMKTAAVETEGKSFTVQSLWQKLRGRKEENVVEDERLSA
jgi:hypothetical protein